MLQAYIDDSASNKTDQRLFLAGYINEADRWTRFSKAWAEELRQPPAIAYLKMSDANALEGEFRGWNAKDRDEKLRGLARVIRHFEPRSIHASVSQSAFRTIVAPVAPHGFSTPYSLCFPAMILPLAIRQANEGSKLTIDFIFDNQESLGTQAAFFYDKIRREQPKHIREVMCASPVFRDEKEVLPLQAADMLAWHIRRRHEASPGAFQVPDFLSHDGLHIAVDIPDEHLRHIADGYSKIPDVSKLQGKSAWKKIYRKLERLESNGVDTRKINRPGVYYPKSAPILLRAIGAFRRWLSNPHWPPRNRSR